MNRILVIFAIILCGTAFVFGEVVSVPKVTGPIAVAADSIPFLAANRSQEPVDLSKRGYVEEEFLVSGTANVYDWAADGRLSVKVANAPYTTRILIRRPSDPARFSGNAVVELLNTARGYDWPFIWAYSREYFMDHGDAWVGVTQFPANAEALKKYNPKRYAAISWANPNQSETCGQDNAKSDTEEGLRWDIISQVGALLKSNFNAQYVYMSSHLGDTATYVNAIHSHASLANGKPVYDGYLIKSEAGLVRIRRCAPNPAANDPRQITKNVNVPVIRQIAQGDVLSTAPYRRPDSDEPGDKFRLYEVAAASRIDSIAYHQLPIVQDQVAVGAAPFLAHWPLNYQCEPEIPLTTLPATRYAANAAFAAIDLWARKGTPAPKAERLAIRDLGTPQAAFMTDQYGNPVGGVRSPYLEVPIATYYSKSPGQQVCANLGHADMFGWGRVEKMYGSYEKYTAKLSRSVERMVKERWLTEADGKRIMAELAPPVTAKK
jgi:hypothetical protein